MSVDSEVITTAAPAPAGRRQTILGWVAVAVIVALVTALTLLIAVRTPESHPAMDPESASATGTMALAQLLRTQGVDLTVARSRDEVYKALQDDSTLVFPNPPALSDDAVVELVEAARHSVLLSGNARLLRVFNLGNHGAAGTGPLEANCTWAPFARIGQISPSTLFTPNSAVAGCFVSDAGQAAVLIDQRTDRSLLLVDGATLFTNEFLAQNGNAALGLAMLGQTGHVVWYVPSINDTDLEWSEDQTLGTLTPGWVTPAIVLLLLAGVAAAIWRGRRFGPLVEETLPVTVRASETMLGRAHLTARAGDAAHAAMALRTGSIRRLGQSLGLSSRATPTQVAEATADRLHMPRASVTELLLGSLPTNDRELSDFARQLSELEEAINLRTRNERNTQ